MVANSSGSTGQPFDFEKENKYLKITISALRNQMEKIGMFWGSNTGNQEEAAGFLKEYMISEGFEIDEYNIAEQEPKKMLEYKYLIIGCPTWHIGELQDDWDFIYEDYKKLDFKVC